ncbi:hypothetical protein EHS25_007416 [Saitozyma podzolica]|uniref:Beta-xylosidase C-terminal Concanavalin A-like domain-containing protein n=1 Tax=Saitozyma podzolica TaxID=1890683 RepID=A0A427YPP5_9TREE|nr:hypothetical protein EHS25_007416 [Saitozyma podzolica]
MAFRNPIIPGFNPDPTICRVGLDYFLATSTFEYFPGVPTYTSRDLVSWRLIGHALNRRSQLDLRAVESGGGIFAPTLRYHDGRWYMTTTCFHRRSPAIAGDTRIMARGFYVWTEDIWDQSRWSDPIYFDATGIDQDLFFGDDGKVYLTWAKYIPELDPMPPKHYNLSCFTMQVDLATGRSLSPARMVRHNSTIGNWVSEGPHILKRGEWYYLITADGGTHTAHQEWVCRSKQGPFGPWEEGPPGINPVVYNGDDGVVTMTGHMDMVEGTDGRWWAVCLAVRPQNGHQSQLGRETFLMPVEWVNNWPVVNGGHKIGLCGPLWAGLPRIPPESSWVADFKPNMGYGVDESSPDLGAAGWYHLRTPVRPDYDLTTRPGTLGILGGPYGLDEDESLSMVLRKQTTFHGVWRVTINFDPHDQGQGQGSRCGGAKLVFRYAEPNGTSFKETTFPAPTGAIAIEITATPEDYSFALVDAVSGKSSLVGTASAASLTHRWPLSSPFTGTHVALYAHGYGGVGCRSPAWFSDVSWRGVREGGP